MIPFYVCRQEPSITVSWETSSSSRCRQMQRSTTKHHVELWKSCGRVGDRIEQAWGVKDTTERPTASTTLGIWGLTETQPSTREHGEARHRSPYMFVNIQLSLHKDPQTIGAEAASVSVPWHCIPFPTTWLGLSRRGYAQFFWNYMSCSGVLPKGCFSFSEEKERGWCRKRIWEERRGAVIRM